MGHHQSKGKETDKCEGYNFSCLNIFPTSSWQNSPGFIMGNDLKNQG